MKDIFEAILKYIPAYLDELISLLVKPKSFIGRKNRYNLDSNFINALVFLGISMSLAWLLQAQLIGSDDFISQFISALVRVLFLVVLYSAVLRLSWRIVGGKAGLKAFMITYAYYTGVVIIIIVLFALVGQGIIKTFSPDLYEVIRANDPVAISDAAPFNDQWFVTGFVMTVVGIVAASIWAFVGWGAYRQLNNLTKRKSFIAMFLTGLFSIPIQVAMFFITKATS